MKPSNLQAMLERMRRTPLNRIQTDEARELVDGLLQRGSVQPPVEVARFGSAI